MIDKEKLNEISAYDLLFKISWYDKEKRLSLYQDKAVAMKLATYLEEAKKNYWHYFRKLAEMIDIDEIFIIFPNQTLIDYLKNNKDYAYIFFCTLLEKNINETLKIILDNDALFTYLIDSMDYTSSILENLTYVDAWKIINKIKKLNLIEINKAFRFITVLKDEIQKQIIEEIEDEELLVKVVASAGIEVRKNFFLNDKRAINIINRFNVVSLSKQGIKFNSEILHHPAFFEQIKSTNIIDMRRNINIVEEINPSNQIRENVIKYYTKIVDSYDKETGMVDILKPQYEMYGEFAKQQTTTMLSQLVVDGLFEDNINNVKLNIKEIIRYNEQLDPKVLDDSIITFYQTILDIEKMTNEEKINLYNHYKDKNIYTMFYNHLYTLKNLSYNQMNNSLFKTNQREDCLVKNIKENFGIEVYDLVDKEYTMLVRCLSTPFRENTRNSRDCYTLISNENNNVMDKNYFIYGYDYFDVSKILHVHESDSFSSSVNENTTSRINRIMTSDEVVNSMGDLSYSEIQIQNERDKEGYKSLKPSYLICYGRISEEDLEESKRLNIPICILKENFIIKDQNKEIENGKYIL